MSSKTIHILHLSSQALRWATLTQKGRQCRIEAMETLQGEAPDVLERWLDKGGDRAGQSIRLYDSRPMVFSFAMNLPAKARRQLDDAVRLRIRSELGLGPESVYWTMRPAASAKDPQMLEVTVMVVRRNAMDDLAAWRDRHGLDALWVATDFSAIAALSARGLLQAPVTMINSEAVAGSSSPAAVYRVEASGAIYRNRVRHMEMATSSAKPDEPPPLYFSGEATPAGIGGPFSFLEPHGDAWRPFNGDDRLEALCRFDPVVLGGALVHVGGDMAGRGLLECHEPQTGPLMRRIEHFQMRQLALATLVLAVLAAVSVWAVGNYKENARQRVIRQASLAMREIGPLSSEEAVLRTVKADRSPLIPVIESIHKAAPDGIFLESLSIGDSGLIRIDGTAQNPDAPNQFFKALAEDGALDKVHMPQVGSSPQGKGFRFQLTAQMKGRK